MSLNLPDKFIGCMWDDGWEFDAPAVIYFPRRFRRYGCGGNTGAIDELLEEICEAISQGDKISDGGLEEECEWRKWGRRFDRRRNADHVVYRVKWYLKDDEIRWEIIERTECFGLPETKGGES